MGNIQVDTSVSLYLGEVAHTAQQSVGDTGRSARAAGNLHGGILVDGNLQDGCRAQDNLLQRVGLVVLQVHVDAETGTQGGRQHTAPRCGTDEREGIQVNLYAPCRRTFVDHDVDAIVFHGGVEIFFHHGRQPVNLVDEEHVVGFERSQNACQVAGFVEHRTAGNLESHPQFVGDDVRQRGLSQSGRSVKERVVERLATVFGSLHEHFKILHHLLLSAKVSKAERSQSVLEILFGSGLLLSDVEICLHLAAKLV